MLMPNMMMQFFILVGRSVLSGSGVPPVKTIEELMPHDFLWPFHAFWA